MTGRKTILVLGGNRSQVPAISAASQMRLRVAVVDGNKDSPGLKLADFGLGHNFADVETVVEFAREVSADGVLAFGTDAAVPVAARVASSLGLVGVSPAVAELMTDKLLMRRALARAGVKQPRFVEVDSKTELDAAYSEIGGLAVLKPSRSAGQRGVYQVGSIEALAAVAQDSIQESRPPKRAILEEYVRGDEVNVIAIIEDGKTRFIVVSDRVRPDGPGFGVGWLHLFPSRHATAVMRNIYAVCEAAVAAVGIENGIVFPQVLIDDAGDARVVEIAARMAGGQMWDVVEIGTGIEILRIAIKQACGMAIRPDELEPSRVQPVAIRFLIGPPGDLPTGVLDQIPDTEAAAAVSGVKRIGLNMVVGKAINPPRVDGDRLGYVLAVGETVDEACRAADRAARMVGEAVKVRPALAIADSQID